VTLIFHQHFTSSSADVVIANRTGYNYGILANHQTSFGYKFSNGRMQDLIQWAVYESTQTLSTQA